MTALVDIVPFAELSVMFGREPAVYRLLFETVQHQKLHTDSANA